VAWFIEDLSGKIDAEQMGALSGSRSTGTNPEEISLTNMTRTNGTLIFSGSTNLMTNAANRKLFFTPGLLANKAISGLTNTDDLRYFATGLREFRPINKANMNGMLDWIPSGIPVNISGTSTNPYPNSGYSKLNLNQLISLPYPSNVESIASVISSNLPKFASTRAGGFNSSAYCSALAANIIDYTDTNNLPTFVAGATNVRGVEAVPFVNERVTFFNVIKTNTLTTALTNGIATTIVTQDFYEFWNPANKPTLPVTLSIVASNNLSFDLGCFNAPFAATNSAGQDVQVGVTTNSFSIPSIQPNGFFVTNSLMVTNIFLSQIEFPPAFPLNYSESQNFFSYKVYLGSVNVTNLYDQTLIGCYVSSAGVLPLNLNDSSSGNRRFFGSYSAFAAQTPRNTFRTAVGDPRMMFYLNDNQDQITYGTGSSFGGRNVRSAIKTNNNYYEVSIPSWPDTGHNSSAGTSAGTSFPSEIPLAAYLNAAPGRISDSGSLTNICELGAIYDPIQWRDPTFKTASGFGSETNGGQWTILTTNATPDSQYGGGNSLRIGRPEHSRFAFINFASNSTPAIPNMGGSSAALLDLFCVSNGDKSGGPIRTGGKINLNTAPAPVLRALAGGILLTNDPSQSPTNAIVPPGMAEAFAQGVMRFRSQYPFLTPSHLSFIGTDPAWPNTNSWPSNSVFGNKDSISLATNSANNLTNTSLGVTEWNDQAAEEWFSKIYNLSTVQSDNYRVYIVAQLVATNANGQTNAISPVARKYVQFANRPDTATSVSFSNNTKAYNVDMYFWAIKKGLKKVYESPY